ncbi:MAG: CPBP family intramembrane metalloprotease [Oscillospiraceae bacterium]|nr:CPBP family intramembrane metalloprotease [Oscillospiraceae bacterium]
MEMTLSMIFSSIFQVLLFSIIPFIIWLIFARKKENFFKWLGFKKPVINKKPQFFLLFIGSFILLSVAGELIKIFFIDKETTAASQFHGLGIAGLVPALFYAFIQTGLSEEIVFRGFIGKRAINKWGFTVGNTIQAVLFGLLHGVMFLPSAGIFAAVIAVVFTGFVGFIMGYLNERSAGGSIVPSWIMHGLANYASALVMMFDII